MLAIGKLTICRNVTKELLQILKAKTFWFFSAEKNNIFFALLVLNLNDLLKKYLKYVLS